ncbi:hypothetical protein AFCDBAGC_3901 [Methylobacterium cerastii]|uniref:Secreted protein n=1 Tax=Methylobacterium cerastii TaxID=932741 RepID=A0ABQ4QL91_9HYPH|nr:hypothetical protein AFCDBAGC_3901 [Methylobacterium cerastii]
MKVRLALRLSVALVAGVFVAVTTPFVVPDCSANACVPVSAASTGASFVPVTVITTGRVAVPPVCWSDTVTS